MKIKPLTRSTLTAAASAELATVLDSPEWFARRIDRCSPLASNEARCIVLQDSEEEPSIHIFSGRSAHRVSPAHGHGRG